MPSFFDPDYPLVVPGTRFWRTLRRLVGLNTPGWRPLAPGRGRPSRAAAKAAPAPASAPPSGCFKAVRPKATPLRPKTLRVRRQIYAVVSGLGRCNRRQVAATLGVKHGMVKYHINDMVEAGQLVADGYSLTTGPSGALNEETK